MPHNDPPRVNGSLRTQPPAVSPLRRQQPAAQTAADLFEAPSWSPLSFRALGTPRNDRPTVSVAGDIREDFLHHHPNRAEPSWALGLADSAGRHFGVVAGPGYAEGPLRAHLGLQVLSDARWARATTLLALPMPQGILLLLADAKGRVHATVASGYRGYDDVLTRGKFLELNKRPFHLELQGVTLRLRHEGKGVLRVERLGFNRPAAAVTTAPLQRPTNLRERFVAALGFSEKLQASDLPTR